MSFSSNVLYILLNSPTYDSKLPDAQSFRKLNNKNSQFVYVQPHSRDDRYYQVVEVDKFTDTNDDYLCK